MGFVNAQDVAKVGEVSYEILPAAIEAANNGETIYLKGDASGAGSVIDKSITIDLGSYTYSFTEGVGSGHLTSNGFQILQGEVNIDGNTNITANNEGDKAYAFDVCKFASYDAPTVNVNTTGTIICIFCHL